MNYKFLHSGGDWRTGDVVTEKDITASNLGSVQRLLDLKTVEVTDEDPIIKDRDGARSANETKGDSVEVGTDDSVDKRAERRAEAVGVVNDGKRTSTDEGKKADAAGAEGQTYDAAARENPRTGSPGTVIRTTGASKAETAKRGDAR